MNETYQTQQNEEAGVSINLREIGQLLLSKLLWILLVAAVLLMGTFIYTKITEVPQYRSNATLFFVCDHSNPANAIAVATYQAQDYSQMAVKQETLDIVIENLGLNMSYKQLASMITVEYGEEARIISISVTDKYPNRAQTILDEVCRVTKELTVDRSSAGALTSVFGRSSVAEQIGSAMGRNLLLAFLVGVVGSVGVIVAIYLLDDKIKSPDTVTRALGVSTLGAIPYQRVKEEELLGGEG